MYMHIGNDIAVAACDIIAILRVEDLMDKREPLLGYGIPEEEYIHVSREEPIKTYIVTTTAVYTSPVTIQTLMSRLDEFSGIISIQSIV